MSSGHIDAIVADSGDGGNERQKVATNNAGVMGSWPDTKIGDGSAMDTQNR